MTRYCNDCGTAFEAKGDWMKRCWRCWRQREDEKTEDEAYKAGYEAGHATAREAYRIGYENGLEAGRRHQGPKGLADDLLRQLIQLCQPDRHPQERWQMANTATARLLELQRGVDR